MVIKKLNARTLGLSWPRYVDSRPQTTTSVQQGISLKTRSYTVRFIYTQAGCAFHVLLKAHKQEAKKFI